MDQLLRFISYVYFLTRLRLRIRIILKRIKNISKPIIKHPFNIILKNFFLEKKIEKKKLKRYY